MGAITSSSVSSLGSGYIAGDVIEIAQGGNLSATIAIYTVDGLGVPLTYALPDQGFAGFFNDAIRGCGYFVQNNVPTFNGGSGGSGFVINILAVGPGTDATHGRLSSGIVVPGRGYAVNDTGLFVQGSNQSACYRVTTIFPGSGGVAFFNFDPGDGYTLGPVTTIPAGPQPGSGSGFTRNSTGVSPCSSGPRSGNINRLQGGGASQ